jgi:hypothetical protein
MHLVNPLPVGDVIDLCFEFELAECGAGHVAVYTSNSDGSGT